MLKLWLVVFSNGEEWHIFGEKDQLNPHNWGVESITFVRAYRR